MADEQADTETIEETPPAEDIAPESDPQQDPPAEAVNPTPVTPAQPPSKPAIDIDAELQAKELLAEKLEAGLILYEEYAKQVATHDRNIVKGQREQHQQLRESIQPIQEQQQVKASNQRYFAGWGSGKDVANLKFGKTVPRTTAAKLFAEAEAEFEADPTYRNRPEFDPNTIVRMKWMEKLEAASKGKAASARQAPAASAPSTRSSGAAGVSQPVQNDNRTAREKLDAGDYDGLETQAKNLGMI